MKTVDRKLQSPTRGAPFSRRNRRRFYACVMGLLACFSHVHGADEHVLLWGDTHLHSSYSFDAFLNGNLTADPDTAYRFAKGEPVLHPYHRARVQLGTPLDFLVVADHAELLGAVTTAYEKGYDTSGAGPIDRLIYWYRTRKLREAVDEGRGVQLFRGVLPRPADPYQAAARWREAAAERGAAFTGTLSYIPDTWADITATADRHNKPGEFTALIGWEWSSIPGGANLHRVVITDADGETARSFLPFASTDSPYPQDLWAWLEKTSTATGASFVAIPHNSNVSKGLMFGARTLRNEPLDADYARTRMRWESVVEVTQIKGDSETHPEFSPDDEFADFALYPWYIQAGRENYVPRPGDYIRPALKQGLALGVELGVNPFQFGLIGSTDSHTGLASAEETNFWGKMAKDSIPANKGSGILRPGPTGWSMSAQGLAAVWAEDNTREAIVAAFKRRELYATTGTRILLRFVGGWNFRRRDLRRIRSARDRGVVMGGVLKRPAGETRVPVFMMQALRDANSAPLDRIQIVKGWLDASGIPKEKVFDVTWAGDREPDESGKLPPLDNHLNLRDGSYDDKVGSARLQAIWWDLQFDPTRPAFYYVRVLETPTLRHAQYDAVALGLEKPDRGAQTIQERAYSSPIWYEP